MTVRGRVVASSDGAVLVRTQEGASRVPAGGARLGDLVESRDGETVVVRRFEGNFPPPQSEVARLVPARMRAIGQRSTGLAAIRSYFAANQFIEIEAPLLVASPGLELHLDAVSAGDGWLITSPEYQLKRLLVAGFQRIYSLCRCFRRGEDGNHHSAEFTMLEWYRAFDNLDQIRLDTEKLVSEVATAVAGHSVVRYGGRTIDLGPPWPVFTVAELFSRHAGLCLRGDESVDELRSVIDGAGLEVGDASAWDDLFYCVFVDHIEPALAALDHPVVVTEWPVRLAALAQRNAINPAVVDRFEVYVAGLELANAFGELTCAVEQRRRFEDELAERRRRGKAIYPLDGKLLAALAEGMPPSGGIALGVDRLMMLVTDSASIGAVQAFASGEL